LQAFGKRALDADVTVGSLSDSVISKVKSRLSHLKQSLKVKTFVGTSENAVQTQIWTALIAMLLVKYLQLRSTFGWSLSNLVALLRQQLFESRD
jgi:hypothetical protein